MPNTQNDNNGTSLNSRVTFTAASAGTYYIAAGGSADSTGSYRLSVNEDDFDADISTTGQIAVGGTATGVINYAGDQDWFRVNLAAGQPVVVDMEGNTLGDAYIRGVYDSGLNLLPDTSNDDYNTSNSHVTFMSERAAIYYIAAGGSADSTGSYRLSVQTCGDIATGVVDTFGDYDVFRLSGLTGAWRPLIVARANDDVLPDIFLDVSYDQVYDGGMAMDYFIYVSNMGFARTGSSYQLSVSDGDLTVIEDEGRENYMIYSPNFGLANGATVPTSSGTRVQSLYNGTTGGLSFDSYGSSSLAAVQVATLTNSPTLASSDFQVVAA